MERLREKNLVAVDCIPYGGISSFRHAREKRTGIFSPDISKMDMRSCAGAELSPYGRMNIFFARKGRVKKAGAKK